MSEGFFIFNAMVSDAIYEKMRKYCAYQERCHDEVRSKILSLKVYGKDLDAIISRLIEEDFLNEERFAKAYAGGKFRMLKWGKQKITAELKRKKISAYCIKTALTEIDDKTYTKTLDTLLAAALKKYTTGTEYAKKYKAAQYMIAKGYESALVWTKLKNIRTD